MRVSLKAPTAEPKLRSWLKEGKEYVVLAVESAVASSGSAYRLESEDNDTPVLFEAELFQIVDGRLPPTWIAVYEPGSPIQLMPRAWSADGYWEAFFDGEPEARRVYEEEKRRIQSAFG